MIPLTQSMLSIGESADPYATSLYLFRNANFNIFQGGKISEAQQSLITSTKDIATQFNSNAFGSISTFTCQMLGVIKHKIFNDKIG